jgi:hypothetical protein
MPQAAYVAGAQPNVLQHAIVQFLQLREFRPPPPPGTDLSGNSGSKPICYPVSSIIFSNLMVMAAQFCEQSSLKPVRLPDNLRAAGVTSYRCGKCVHE